jgi:RimJ/RimL family protein N-acetyltransferase
MVGPPELTDGVVVLRPVELGDVAEHLAGEDEELVRWLNGGPGTRETVEAHVRACMAAWEAGGPTITFGIRAGAPERLVGTVDAHLNLAGLEPGQANIAYGLYPHARGRGLASRAVELMCTFLAARHGVREAVIRTDPANTASVAVALRTGFHLARRGGEGELDWYIRELPVIAAPIALDSPAGW